MISFYKRICLYSCRQYKWWLGKTECDLVKTNEQEPVFEKKRSKKEVKSLEYFSILLISVSSSVRKIFLTSSQNADLQFNPEEVNYLNGFFHIRRILFTVLWLRQTWDKVLFVREQLFAFSKRRCIDENIFDQILCLFKKKTLFSQPLMAIMRVILKLSKFSAL